jgi:hypothetical protein
MKRYLLIVIAFALTTGSAFAQGTDIPRTFDGHPDFQGYWSNEFLTPLERIQGASALIVTDAEAETLVAGIIATRGAEKFDPGAAFPEARQLAKVKGAWRTSQVIDPADGKLPLTPEGLAIRNGFPKNDARATDNPEDRAFSERCLAGPSRAPILSPVEGMYNQIVQTPAFLVFLADHYAELRTIGIGAQPRPAGLVSWAGDSTAKWEGDTLVVETTHARAADEMVRRGGVLVGPQSRVVEHFQLISPDELLYQFTVEDPANYTLPWTAEYSFMRTNSPVMKAITALRTFCWGAVKSSGTRQPRLR